MDGFTPEESVKVWPIAYFVVLSEDGEMLLEAASKRADNTKSAHDAKKAATYSKKAAEKEAEALRLIQSKAPLPVSAHHQTPAGTAVAASGTSAIPSQSKSPVMTKKLPPNSDAHVASASSSSASKPKKVAVPKKVGEAFPSAPGKPSGLPPASTESTFKSPPG